MRIFLCLINRKYGFTIYDRISFPFNCSFSKIFVMMSLFKSIFSVLFVQILIYISFPFFFGMMFGDIGHGFLLLLFSLYLLFFNNRNLAFLQKGKYLLVFMGFFSLFCGFIYNDFFGFQLNLFGSCYNKIGNSIKVGRKEDCVYIFGIDPVWGVSNNELTFMNSFKMKICI